MGEEFGRKFRSLGRRLSLVTTRVKGEGKKEKTACFENAVWSKTKRWREIN